jgi:hypothetical protein
MASEGIKDEKNEKSSKNSDGLCDTRITRVKYGDHTENVACYRGLKSVLLRVRGGIRVLFFVVGNKARTSLRFCMVLSLAFLEKIHALYNGGAEPAKGHDTLYHQIVNPPHAFFLPFALSRPA